MKRRRIGIYIVEYNGSEIGYLRYDESNSKICSYSGVDVRTPILGRYNSYTHAVLCDLDTYSKMSGIWDLTLVDEYEEYYTL